MPTTSSRLRVLLAAAGLAAFPLVALAVPGTAVAEPSPPVVVESPSAEPDPTPTSTCTPLTCVLPTTPPPITASPTPSPTPSPTASAVPSRTPTASPTPRRTRSPRPQSTFTAEPGSTEDPVTATIGVGGVVPESASPTLTPKTSSSESSTGDKITRLLALVLGGAALLGVSGATGLYLTRHRHDH